MGFLSRLFKSKGARRREYEMAQIGRILADWNVTEAEINELIKGNLSTLRNRSRTLAENNAYGKKYMNLLKTNVVGPEGFKLYSTPLVNPNDPKSGIDFDAARIIEAGWKRFCRKGQFTVCGKLSMIDVLNQLVTSVPRDGEFLARKLYKRQARNAFGFALQVIPAEKLDIQKSDKNQRITMGVQSDEWGKPTKYFLLNPDPNSRKKHLEISADKMFHLFASDYAGQVRGKPWTTASGVRLHLAGKYEIAELIAARMGASKGGYLERDPNAPASEYPEDDRDAEGNKIIDIQPGMVEELPTGLTFKEYDPQHPTTAYPDFMQSSLQGAAAGFNVQHSSLTANLSKGNFGSLRLGALEERDVWKCFQGWVIEHFLTTIFEEWAEMAVLTNALKLPPAKLENWQRHRFQGRRWVWVDPSKDAKASELQKEMGVVSEIRLAGELGFDLLEIYEEIALAKQWRETLKISDEGE